MDDNAVWIGAVIVGFFAIPVLADVNPPLINGFLLLVLFSTLLLQRERWLPYLLQLQKQSTVYSSPKNIGGRGPR